MKKIAIIGGGITGLSAAYAIQKAVNEGRDIDYILLEKDIRLGGKIYTERTGNGFVVEGGPDSFISTKPSIFELAKKLNCDGRIIPSNDDLKKTYILVGNRLRTLPDGVMMVVPTKVMPFITTDLFSWPGKLRMAMDYFIPKKKEPGDETLSSFVARRLGNECLYRLADPLVAGVYSSDPETMSLQATFPILLDMEQKYGSLIKGTVASMKSRAKAQHGGHGGHSSGPKRTLHMSFRGGMQDLIDEVVKTLDKDKILIGADVQKVDEVKGEDGSTNYRIHLAGGKAVVADAVIFASLAHETANLITGIDNILASILKEIPQTSAATVSLAYRKSDVKHDFRGFGFLIPLGEGYKIKGCTWSSTKWSGRVPGDDYAVIRVFLGGARKQELTFLPDDEMLSVVKSEIKKIMGIDTEPINSWIFRWPNSMPQYTLGHLDRIKKIDERVAAYPGIFLAGASYRGVGIPDCINSGTKSAESALAYLGSPAGPTQGFDENLSVTNPLSASK